MKTELHQDALNDAGWKLLEELQKLMDVVPNRVFNNIKPALAAAIEVYQIKATSPAPWNGEDLPPVGLEVEGRVAVGHYVGATKSDWAPCALVCASRAYLVLRCIGEGYSADHEVSHERALVEFRPIRTAEQIAAEERGRAITSILKDSGTQTLPPITYTHAAELYDAGYRKVEQ